MSNDQPESKTTRRRQDAAQIIAQVVGNYLPPGVNHDTQSAMATVEIIGALKRAGWTIEPPKPFDNWGRVS